MTIILGIDPGSRVTGYGLVEKIGHKYRYIESGVIRIDHADLAKKLKKIYDCISQIITEYQPVEAAIEKVFMAKNADSALKLGQARGAAITALASFELPVHEYSAREIKKNIVGSGRAEKTQIQQMTKWLLQLSSVPQEDAADALAIAMCHGNLAEGRARLKAYEKKAL